MKLLLTPRHSDDHVEYVFKDNRTVVVTYNDVEETFDLENDFTRLDEGEDTIKRKKAEKLPINPIISVRDDDDGERYVNVFRYHGDNPSKNVIHPKWQEVKIGETYPYPLA